MTRTRTRLPGRASRVTLREVAAHAGVSESTVSRIMRDQDIVADATRGRVMESVRSLGYVPDRIAGSLASMSSHLVGVIVPSLTNIVFAKVLQGINAGLGSSAYQAVISIDDYDLDRQETLVRGILAWRPAAILIAGSGHTRATCLMLRDSGVRVVEMMDIDCDPIDVAVGMSHRRAGREVGVHLVRKGYRRFGYIGHDWIADTRARVRYDGFVAAVREAGAVVIGNSIADGPSSVETGRRQTARLCAEADPEIIVYSNDDMAIGGVFHCIRAGISVPGSLALFGFNGLDIGQALPQPLSTIRSNRFAIGKAAVDAIRKSSGRPATKTVIDTGFEILEGETA